MLKIAFEWSRDGDGYRLIDDRAIRSGKLKTRPGLYSVSETTLKVRIPQTLTGPQSAGRGLSIVPNGGKEHSYFPLGSFDKIFPVFVKDCINADGALAFVRKFGPLTTDGKNPRIGESVQFVLSQADSMRRLLDAYLRKDAANLSDAISSGLSIEAREKAILKLSLAMDAGSDEVGLTLTVPDLIGALWIQCFQFISGGQKLRSCLECGTFFEVGAGRQRRLDAKFCSDQHRVDYNSRNR